MIIKKQNSFSRAGELKKAERAAKKKSREAYRAAEIEKAGLDRYMKKHPEEMAKLGARRMNLATQAKHGRKAYLISSEGISTTGVNRELASVYTIRNHNDSLKLEKQVVGPKQAYKDLKNNPKKLKALKNEFKSAKLERKVKRLFKK